MNYQDYEAEDFLLNPSFRNYCLGINEEDRVFWEEWIVLHPEKYGAVLQAKQLFELLNGSNTAQNYREDVKAFRARMEQHLAGEGTTGEPKVGTDGTHEGAGANGGDESAVGDGAKENMAEEVVPVGGSTVSEGTVGVGGIDADTVVGSLAGMARSLQKWYWLGAAAVLIPLVFFITGKMNHVVPEGKSSGEYARSSPAGERKSFQLPDGTKVMLNAGSIIRISKDFNKAGREISLEGEAFFDVISNANNPFIIHTSSMDVKVLGTTFNVKAYPEDKMSEASLLNGSVEILVKKDHSTILLHPSEKILIPNVEAAEAPKSSLGTKQPYSLGKLVANPLDSSIAEVSWTENKLAFTDDSFEEIATALERWYNVSIRFEDSTLKLYRFTATFDKKTIEQVLNALAASRPFEYRLEQGNKIFIKNIEPKN